MKDDRPQLAMQLRTLRMARGFTNQKAAAAHVRAETGVRGLSDSVWGEYESGRRDEHGKLIRPMSAKHREAIEQVFGPLEAQAPDAPAASDIASLVAAIDRNTAVLTEVLLELRDERRRVPSWLDAAVVAQSRFVAREVIDALRTHPTD